MTRGTIDKEQPMDMRIAYTCDNASFEEGGWVEHTLVLGRIQTAVALGRVEGDIHDSNGNRIGSWTLA